MIAVALKGLAGRKVRALLTAFAVVIGVSMVSGTFILTDTMQKTFDGLFDASYGETDAVIAGKADRQDSTSGIGHDPGRRCSTASGAARGGRRRRRGLAAGGQHRRHHRRDGKAVPRRASAQHRPRQRPLQPVQAQDRRLAAGPRQVVIDAGTAKKQHFAVGDTVKVATPGKTAAYEVTGTARFGDVDSLGFGSIAVWDLRPPRRCSPRGALRLDLDRAPRGTSAAELVRAVKPLVPDALEVKDSAAAGRRGAEQLDKGMAYIRYFLLGFGGIALFVGAFVIFNTLSITVAQRTREFATLRTLGASRKQVLRSVRLEGLVMGLLASTIGLVPRLRDRQGHARAVQRARASTCRRPGRCSRSGR